MKKLLLILGCSLAAGIRLRKDTEIGDEQLDEFERQAELQRAETFEPSAELAESWKASMKLNFAKVSGSLEELPHICKGEIQRQRTNNDACEDPWEKTAICRNAYEVPSYRLGDVFYEFHPENTFKYVNHYFPRSIAAKYIKAIGPTNKHHKPQDVNQFVKVLNRPEYAEYEKPSPKDVIVHLRLGDVLYTQKPGYVRSFEHYEKMAKKAKKQNLTSIVLVTGDHRVLQKHDLNMHGGGEWFKAVQKQTKSRMAKIQKIFEEHGLTVTQRVNYNADCDVIYISNAKFFVESGGGFSRLMSSVVKANGGEVWS